MFSSYASFIALLLAFTSFAANCATPVIPLPEGWSSHSFKLLQHPDTYVGGQEAFDRVVTYATFADDTRKGLRMTDREDFSFDVFLPRGGSDVERGFFSVQALAGVDGRAIVADV